MDTRVTLIGSLILELSRLEEPERQKIETIFLKLQEKGEEHVEIKFEETRIWVTFLDKPSHFLLSLLRKIARTLPKPEKEETKEETNED